MKKECQRSCRRLMHQLRPMSEREERGSTELKDLRAMLPTKAKWIHITNQNY